MKTIYTISGDDGAGKTTLGSMMFLFGFADYHLNTSDELQKLETAIYRFSLVPYEYRTRPRGFYDVLISEESPFMGKGLLYQRPYKDVANIVDGMLEFYKTQDYSPEDIHREKRREALIYLAEKLLKPTFGSLFIAESWNFLNCDKVALSGVRYAGELNYLTGKYNVRPIIIDGENKYECYKTLLDMNPLILERTQWFEGALDKINNWRNDG